MEKTGWSQPFLDQLKGWFDQQNQNSMSSTSGGEAVERPGRTNELHHQGMRAMAEHIIKWVSDITEPVPLLSPGPSLMRYRFHQNGMERRGRDRTAARLMELRLCCYYTTGAFD